MKVENTLQRAKEICPTTTARKLTEGAILVDVRRQEEVDNVTYDVAHYLNIPLSQLEERMSEVPKDKEVVLACRSGQRSLKATYFLMNHGYEKVFNLKDGLLKWVAKDFPAKGNVQGLLDTMNCDCSKPNCC